MASGHFKFLGETFFASLMIACWPLPVGMPPTKVCPQCKAAVPVRWKTCERCDLVFRKAECICERKQFNDETYGSSRIRVLNQLGKLKISCTRPVKERQKLMSERCMGRNNKTMRMGKHERVTGQ